MKIKSYLTLVILLTALGLSTLLPQSRYENSISMSTLFQIPENMGRWHGRDISGSLDINLEEIKFGFISDALAYSYMNDKGRNLIFILLDAGNFHHPKNCFISSGYKIKEMPDTEFQLPDRKLKTHTLFIKRDEKSFISFYWIVINKNVAHEWIEQKFKQLYFSLLNKKRVGLMVRIDIPTKEDNLNDAIIISKQFVNDLHRAMPSEEADYLFGKIE